MTDIFKSDVTSTNAANLPLLNDGAYNMSVIDVAHTKASAWCQANVDGTTTTSYGLTSITDSSAGTVTLNFSSSIGGTGRQSVFLATLLETSDSLATTSTHFVGYSSIQTAGATVQFKSIDLLGTTEDPLASSGKYNFAIYRSV